MKAIALKGTLKNSFLINTRRIVRGALTPSIQSVHAFMRHLRGRSGLPLLPSIQPTWRWRIVFFTLMCMTLSLPAIAQDQRQAQNKIEEKRLDLLFNRIMQTLPNQERSQVDSAAVMKSTTRRAMEKTQAVSAPKRIIVETETTRVRQLPPELKEQVERAMADMKDRSVERKAEFIEARHGKK